MSFRSPLARAQGLGSAKTGVHHWWHQRLTAIALAPLLIWIVFCLAMLGQTDYQTAVAWVSNPIVTVLLLALVPTLFYHSILGIQVVLEDYISHKGWRLVLLTLSSLGNILLAIVAIFAILKIAFGSYS